jgi:integrase
MPKTIDDTSLPDLIPLAADLAHLETLAGKARDYARSARAANTRRAYAADWRHYSRWCARRGLPELPPEPQRIGLYIADLASGARLTVASIERRLSGLGWMFRQQGWPLDRADRHITEVLAGIRKTHGRPQAAKDALLGGDIIAMVEQLGRDLRGLRDRAILLVGFAGGLRRSEIVGLDHGQGETEDGRGWVERLEGGVVLHVKGKSGWREVEIAPGSSALTCPVQALRTWMDLGRIVHGPVFRPITRDGKRTQTQRLSDRHVARLVQSAALAAGIRGDLPEGERRRRFAGHSLRAGLATAAEAEERFVQHHLGHATVSMTRRYQRRRDRFRVNLTRAAGL